MSVASTSENYPKKEVAKKSHLFLKAFMTKDYHFLFCSGFLAGLHFEISSFAGWQIA